MINKILDWLSGMSSIGDESPDRRSSRVILGLVLVVTVLLDSLLFGQIMDMIFGDNIFLLTILSILWFILNLSLYRYLNILVANSIKAQKQLSIFALLPFVFLILLSSFIITIPLELRILSNNVYSQLQINRAEKVLDYRSKLETAYKLPELHKEKEDKELKYEVAVKKFDMEISGMKAPDEKGLSSGRLGNGPRAKLLQQEVENAKIQIARVDSSIIISQDKINQEIEHYEKVESATGYYTFTNQLSALGELRSKDANIRNVSWMLRLFMLLLNSLPLIMLFLANSGFRLTFIRDFSDVDKDVNQTPNITISDSSNITVEIGKNTEGVKQETFEGYFNNMISVFDREMERSNQKASILLNRGVWTSILGIVYYLVSIISFQSLFSTTGFHQFHIYGLISSTLLFIFIQFVGAWFLKQYRYFVDTSTYYFKLKTTIERYLLSYLALKENSTKKDEILPKMLDFLMQEIKFPETYLIKQADVNLTKETLESIFSSLNETLKSLKEIKK